jgi:tetratricopeptide (TPR) repeat protein
VASRKTVLIMCLGIFILGFGIRLWNLELIKNNPFFRYPIMDEKYHDEWAQEIQTKGLLKRVPYYRAPAYPYFLSIIYTAFGHDYYIPRLFGAFIGALYCMLILITGSLMFSRKVGLLAGLIACFYSMFIYYDSLLLSVGLEMLFAVSAILFFVLWFQKKHYFFLILSGLCWGLASVTRPTFLICLAVFVIYLFITERGHATVRRLKSALSMLCGALPLIISIISINIIVGKDTVPLAWNGGINFYLGNNPNANGWSATSPDIRKTWLGGYNDAIIIAEQDLHKDLRPSEVSAYWFDKGIRFIRSKPVDWIVLMMRKAYLMVSSYEFPNNQSIKTYQSFSPFMRIPILNFGLVMVLASIGLFITPRTKPVQAARLYLIFYSLTIILFFVPARYRMPLVPILIVFAAYTVFWVVKHITAKQYKKIGLVMVICALGLVFVYSDILNQHADFVDNSMIHATYANHYFEQEQYTEAISEYNKALSFDPANIKTMNALGDTYLKLGAFDDAQRVYLRSLQTQNNADAVFKIGLIHFEHRQLDSAQSYFSQAVQLDSTDPTIFYYAGMAYALDKKARQAIHYLEISLQYHPYARYISNTHLNIGLSYLELDNIPKAKEHLLESGMSQEDVYDLIR